MMMTSHLIVVKVAFDPEADVWLIEHSSFPGLAGEAASFEDLAKRIPNMLADLIEASGLAEHGSEIPVEIIASLGTVVRMNDVQAA